MAVVRSIGVRQEIHVLTAIDVSPLGTVDKSCRTGACPDWQVKVQYPYSAGGRNFTQTGEGA